MNHYEGHKDRFDQLIEPGDEILRARHSTLDKLKVIRCTPRSIITTNVKLPVDKYDNSGWQYINGKWQQKYVADPKLIHIINITKLNQKLEQHD